MIELIDDALTFSFPEVHRAARLTINFQRTLRIPDDGKTYPLPPGLGRFPLRHVDDYARRVAPDWIDHGGVMLPMYQAEALWISFDDDSYPFAIRVATGKIDAVTGKRWKDGIGREPQNYLVVPGQPWLDGYCVDKGVIRQFVAMPLGEGYTAEEQLTGKAEHGGLQISVHPMKAEVYERLLKRRKASEAMTRRTGMVPCLAAAAAPMGLAPGGTMRQEIYEDTFKLEDWDAETSSRCFIHIANSQTWQATTGTRPPSTAPTAAQYTKAGLPWFEYYAEGAAAVPGSGILAGLKSVVKFSKAKRATPIPENESVSPERIVRLRAALSKQQVREGAF